MAYIGKQETEDLIITALEGGSNYWYTFIDLEMVTNDKNAEGVFNWIMENRNAKIPVFDCEASQEDIENRSAYLGDLSYANIMRGKKLLIADRRHFKDLKDENWDANTADVFFQYVVLGELIYG